MALGQPYEQVAPPETRYCMLYGMTRHFSPESISLVKSFKNLIFTSYNSQLLKIADRADLFYSSQRVRPVQFILFTDCLLITVMQRQKCLTQGRQCA